MVDAGPPPGRQPEDVLGPVGPLDGQKGEGRLGAAAGPHPLDGHHHPALKKDRQPLVEGIGKALLGGDADLPQGIGGLHRAAEQVLLGGVLQLDGAGGGGAVGAGGFHLLAAAPDPAADQPQLGHLLVDDVQLAAQHGKAAVEVVVLHVGPYLLQGEADLLHDQDGVEVVQLAGAVVAVAAGRVHPRGAEQPDLVVKDQGLLGDVLVLCHLPDGEEVLAACVFHGRPLDTIVTISLIL